jgi:hypothetical protein
MTETDPFPAPERDPNASLGAPQAAPQAAPVIDHDPAPADPPPAAPPRRGGGGGVALTLVLFLALAGGLYYVWTNPKGQDDGDAIATLQRQVQAQAQAAGQEAAQLQALTQQAQSLADRVDKLEKSAATPAAPPGAAPAADTGDLAKRLDELTAKVAALESQPAGAPAAAPAPQDNGADQQAIAALGQKLDQLQAADKAALDQLQAQQKDALDQAQAASAAQQKAMLDQIDGRIGKLEQGAGKVENAADRAARLERVQAAVVALQAGQKLGEIPDAPPALQKFANAVPPTEAALRESFPALAAHAREVSEPEVAHKTFLQRALARLQESVTVRQGDDVLVGDPAAGVLADAEVKVQNGDLPGAVQRLQALHGPAAAAMQGWVDQAQSLIAARAALASLAARG